MDAPAKPARAPEFQIQRHSQRASALTGVASSTETWFWCSATSFVCSALAWPGAAGSAAAMTPSRMPHSHAGCSHKLHIIGFSVWAPDSGCRTDPCRVLSEVLQVVAFGLFVRACRCRNCMQEVHPQVPRMLQTRQPNDKTNTAIPAAPKKSE